MSSTASTAPTAPSLPRPVVGKSAARFLKVAAKLFREKGYANTTIRDIAKRARVEPSALYYHFASKDALLEAVLDESILSVMAMVSEAVEALPTTATARERMHVAVATHIRGIFTHGDYVQASRQLMGQVPPAVRRKHEAMRAGYGAYWETLFAGVAAHEPFRAAGDMGLARMFLLGAVNWTSEWLDPAKKSPEELAGVLCAILFDGMVAPQAGTSAARKKKR